MNSLPRLALLAVLVALGGCSRSEAPDPSRTPVGHWEGSIQLPTQPLRIRVDLEHNDHGPWTGTIDIPAQGLRGFKLSATKVSGDSVSFAMPGVSGDPKFSGKFNADAKTIDGTFTQGGQTFPFKLEHKAQSEASGEPPARGVSGKGLAGHWMGALKPTPVIELRLTLEITNAPDGRLGGVMTSVDQGNAAIPITALSEKDGVVNLETKSVGGVFNGKLNADGSELAGDWKQGAGTMPLTFKRLAKAASFNRPQEPKKPYPYDEEEVVVENKAAKVKLAGTLTLPRGAGPFPAVVLITGSGPQDRDEAIMGHRPFLVLADHLVRQGIVVLRCDDRGFGKSTASFAKATDTDFVEDALACVAFLRERKEVNPKRIGLVGHSEGGIVAPRAAVKSPEVAFIVLLAGVGVPMEELLVRQAEDIARAMGAGPEPVKENTKLQQEIFRVVRAEKDSAAAEKKLRAVFEAQTASLTEDQRKNLGLSSDMAESQIKMVLTPWFRELLGYDPRPTLKAVKCPVLALNGEKDLQVAAQVNLPAIRDALTASGNRNVKTVELPGLNHLFQPCETGAIAEYGQIEETFSPKALKMISDWILELPAKYAVGRKPEIEHSMKSIQRCKAMLVASGMEDGKLTLADKTASQCRNEAVPGSDYCLEHQMDYEERPIVDGLENGQI